MAEKTKDRPSPQEVREKLRNFLKGGDSEDVASVIFHTLTQRADVAAEVQKKLVTPAKKSKSKTTKKDKPS